MARRPTVAARLLVPIGLILLVAFVGRADAAGGEPTIEVVATTARNAGPSPGRWWAAVRLTASAGARTCSWGSPGSPRSGSFRPDPGRRSAYVVVGPQAASVSSIRVGPLRCRDARGAVADTAPVTVHAPRPSAPASRPRPPRAWLWPGTVALLPDVERPDRWMAHYTYFAVGATACALSDPSRGGPRPVGPAGASGALVALSTRTATVRLRCTNAGGWAQATLTFTRPRVVSSSQ